MLLFNIMGGNQATRMCGNDLRDRRRLDKWWNIRSNISPCVDQSTRWYGHIL